MNAQHPFQSRWRPTQAFWPRVKRLNLFAQVAPGNNLVYLAEKLLLVRGFAKLREAFLGQRSLPHSVRLQSA
jgi:hypothetical protein